MRRNRWMFLFAFCFLAASFLRAQVVITSSIVGTVSDPQSAVVEGATVTLTNVDTGVRWTKTTTASGDYQFPNLIAGQYKVEVVRPGFTHAVSTGIALQNGVTQRVNVRLNVGRATETVQVSAAAPLMNTDDANVSQVIENKFVADLPMEGRNYLNFAEILPGFNSGFQRCELFAC